MNPSPAVQPVARRCNDWACMRGRYTYEVHGVASQITVMFSAFKTHGKEKELGQAATEARKPMELSTSVTAPP
jgi:hypothetical protein